MGLVHHDGLETDVVERFGRSLRRRTSIYPLKAVKPWTRRPGLAEFNKQGQRESFWVPQGFGNGRIKLPRLDWMR